MVLLSLCLSHPTPPPPPRIHTAESQPPLRTPNLSVYRMYRVSVRDTEDNSSAVAKKYANFTKDVARIEIGDEKNKFLE